MELRHYLAHVGRSKLGDELLNYFPDDELVLFDMVTKLLVEQVVDEDLKNALVSL